LSSPAAWPGQAKLYALASILRRFPAASPPPTVLSVSMHPAMSQALELFISKCAAAGSAERTKKDFF